ncbi:hypothetical protein WKT22_04716 [Candidatus Lokiarchaeum ossiferum]
MMLKCFFLISHVGFFWHINTVAFLNNLMSEENSSENKHIQKKISNVSGQGNEPELKSDKKIHYPKGYLARIPE